MIAKLICLWLFVGAYHFWKRGATISDWRRPSAGTEAGPWREDRGGDALQVAPDDPSVQLEKRWGSNSAERETHVHRRGLPGPVGLQDDGRPGWISSNPHGKFIYDIIMYMSENVYE